MFSAHSCLMTTVQKGEHIAGRRHEERGDGCSPCASCIIETFVFIMHYEIVPFMGKQLIMGTAMETAAPRRTNSATVSTMTKVIAALLLASPSLAYSTTCEGKLANLSIDATGTVFVGTALSPTHGICSVVAKGDFSMQTESCKAAYALLMAAKVSGASARLYYNGVQTCAQITGWSVQPSFYHAELL
jgi:hypothetical protein